MEQLFQLRTNQCLPRARFSQDLWPLQEGLVLQARVPESQLERAQAHLWRVTIVIGKPGNGNVQTWKYYRSRLRNDERLKVNR